MAHSTWRNSSTARSSQGLGSNVDRRLQSSGLEFSDVLPWFALAGLILSFFLFGRWMWKAGFSADSAPVAGEYSYQMVRPEEEAPPLLDLSGRPIDRRVLEGRVESEPDLTPEKLAEIHRLNANHLAQVQNRPGKKSVDSGDPKNSNSKKQKSTTAKQAERARKLKEEREKRLLAQDRVRRQNERRATPPAGGATPSAPGFVSSPAAAAPAPQANENDPEAKKPTRTLAQWKEVLQADSNEARNFLAKFNEGEVSERDYFEIAFWLFEDSAEEKSRAGFWLLSLSPSPSGFSQMAARYSKIKEPQKTLLWSLMLTYGQPSRYGQLQAAIVSAEVEVSRLALEVLTLVVQDFSQRLPAAVDTSGASSGSPVTTTNPTNTPNRGNLAGFGQAQQLAGFRGPLRQLGSRTSSPLAARSLALLQRLEDILRVAALVLPNPNTPTSQPTVATPGGGRS